MRSARSSALILSTLAVHLWACSAKSDDAVDGLGAGNGGLEGQGGGLADDPNRPTDIGAECGKVSYANAVAATLLIVPDRSGSMTDPFDKWSPTKTAISAMLDAAPPTLQVGLSPFPAGDGSEAELAACAMTPTTPQCAEVLADGGCNDVFTTPAVPIAALATAQPAILAWMSQNGPTGGTPTLMALTRAYEHLLSVPAEGERIVLLLTDGIPNTMQKGIQFGPLSLPDMNIPCKQLEDIVAETEKAAAGETPIRTFVIGSPGSENAADFLSKLAVAGKTQKSDGCLFDCHYQIGSSNFQAELQTVLSEISGKISDCVFKLPTGDDVDPNLVNLLVELGDDSTQTSKDTDHADGWDYTDDTYSAVKLYGPACEEYKSQIGARVTVVTGCETITK